MGTYKNLQRAALAALIVIATGITAVSTFADFAPGAPAVDTVPVVEVETQAADVVTAIKFVVGHIECNLANRSTFVFTINGVAAGSTLTTTNSCAHNATPLTFNVTSAAAKAACVGIGCNAFKMTRTGTGPTYVAYVRAEITRSISGVEKVCVFDQAAAKTCNDRNTSSGFINSVGPFQNTLPDIDADGTPDCTDLDNDNDTVPDTADNCRLTSNTNQKDSDGNGTGDVCQPEVVAVPWQGNESRPHPVYSGGTVILQASATLNGLGAPIAIKSAKWDTGDGDPNSPYTVSITNSRALQLSHVYSGAVNDPFTATVTITDMNDKVYTDTFRIQIQPNTADVRTNMALDKALWYLHTQMTASGQLGSWAEANGFPESTTAGAVQAFQINGHRATGNPLADPYANDVSRGLGYLFDNLRSLPVNSQNGNNPDSDGNNVALGTGRTTNGDHETYIGGQVIDAIVASGTPDAIATVGVVPYVKNRTYKAIVRDMLDAYAWGATDTLPVGGFEYRFFNNGVNVGTGAAQDANGGDVSASHWWAIGALAAKTWGLDSPQWQKDQNWNFAIPFWQTFGGVGVKENGSCGYRNNGGPGAIGPWSGWEWDNGRNVTPGCMIMMNADGQLASHPRFVAAEGFMAAQYASTKGNFYAMYQLAKAMRTASSPITMLGGSTDWYAGYRDWLLTNQQATGRWDQVGGTANVVQNLSTAWGVIMLSPALFEEGPAAVCRVDSTIVCQAGAVGGCNTTGADPYATVNFDADLSTAGDNPIASYAWNFQDGATATDGTTNHSWSTLGVFNVSLTVTDTKGHQSTATCPVDVVDTALPPIANPGGPYSMCAAGPGTIVIDGSASTGRGSNIVSYQWDFTNPVNFGTVDFSGPTPGDKTAYYLALGPGTYDVGLRVKDDSLSLFTTTRFTSVTILGPGDCDTDGDGAIDREDADDDGDGTPDATDAFPLDPSESLDTDHDGIGNNADTDDDNDGVLDANDAFPTNPAESVDTDLDGIGNNADTDDDGDGVLDANDAFPLNAAESVDTDGDGTGNNADTDDDGDGAADNDDAFPLNAAESIDSDGDGIGNNADPDDDNDGVLDANDPFPTDPAESVDTDADGTGNNADTDDDGDGVADLNDAFPLNAAESVDTDGDGTGNNADTDDDGDGALDVNDAFPLNAAESVDTDNDGTGNNADLDDDNDGVADADDAFPLNAAESVDTDGDGTGNNADTDDDGDGVADANDAFPLNAAESVDTDGDGTGNNADTDDDNDGVADANDAFPLNAAESVDTDGDGTGNNADTDDDGDGVADANDAFPLNAAESVDTDGDGTGNNGDPDDDNDGVLDVNDAFPTNPNESSDNDGDGQGDSGDVDDDNDAVIDSADNCPAVANTNQLNTDGDAQGNACDTDDDNDTVIDTADNCPVVSNTNQLNTDGDAQGNACDTNDDNDAFLDTVDMCPLVAGTVNGCQAAGAIPALSTQIASLPLSATEAGNLTSKLANAQTSLSGGNLTAARGQLGAFQNQVNAFKNSGRLTAAQANALIAAAQAIIDAI